MTDLKLTIEHSNQAESRLALMTSLALVLASSFLFFAFLRTGPRCAIQSWFQGDNDAAAYKIFSVALIYGGAALLLSRINRRFGFYLSWEPP